MSRRWLLSLLCVAVLFFLSVQFTGARGELRVNEAGTKIVFENDPAEVLLEVENPSLAGVNANVYVELLDPLNRVITKTTQAQPIASGTQKLKLALPLRFRVVTIDSFYIDYIIDSLRKSLRRKR